MSRVVSAGVAVLALSATAAFAADPIYKSTMPDGRVIYGESTMPGARRVDKVQPPPEHAGVVVATQEDKANASKVQPEAGGVAVIPQPPRQPTRSAVQGYSANPNGGLTTNRY